jgi:hypothetical protein
MKTFKLSLLQLIPYKLHSLDYRHALLTPHEGRKEEQEGTLCRCNILQTDLNNDRFVR